jgi:hypothetical protein
LHFFSCWLKPLLFLKNLFFRTQSYQTRFFPNLHMFVRFCYKYV